MTVDRIKSLYTQCLGIKTQIQKDIAEQTEVLNTNKENLIVLEEAQAFLQSVAQETQEKLKIKIEDIVNLALDTVFPNEYEFTINFNILRGKTEAELVFLSKRTGKQIDPMNASGGGVVDVVSFALRIACYVLENNSNNVIILDEPMKFVSKDLLDNVALLLHNLSTKLNIQVIMVTHENSFINIADKVFEIKKDEHGVSHVKGE